jgi:hypothetical protein
MVGDRDLSSGVSVNQLLRLTSSSRLGRILLRRNLSEKVGRTLTSPRRKVAFSSRGFDANVVASRKLRVDIASEEKNECEGNDARLRRFAGCLVSSLGKRSASQTGKIAAELSPDSPRSSALHRSHLDPPIQSRRTKLPSA